jgi:hypothetical protein
LNAVLVCAVNSRGVIQGAIKQSQKLRKQLVFPALQVPTKITASQIVNLNTEKKYLNALASNPNLFMNNKCSNGFSELQLFLLNKFIFA